jgi:hypothetical protein
MRKLVMFAIAGGLVLAAGLAWAQKPGKPRQPTPIIASGNRPLSPIPLVGGVSSISATPATITFAANNPGSGTTNPIAGSSTATVSWNVTGSSAGDPWTLKVGTTASNFTGCTTVPASAVTVSCTSSTIVSGSGAGGCTSGTFTLPSTTPGQQVASGTEGAGSNSYSVVLTYQFGDSWKYIADTCPLTITYTASP